MNGIRITEIEIFYFADEGYTISRIGLLQWRWRSFRMKRVYLNLLINN